MAFAAELAAEGLLAEPLAVLPGVGDDADGVGDEPTVLGRVWRGRFERDDRRARRLGGRPGGDQGGDGCLGGLGGGVVKPGEVRGARA